MSFSSDQAPAAPAPPSSPTRCSSECCPYQRVSIHNQELLGPYRQCDSCDRWLGFVEPEPGTPEHERRKASLLKAINVPSFGPALTPQHLGPDHQLESNANILDAPRLSISEATPSPPLLQHGTGLRRPSNDICNTIRYSPYPTRFNNPNRPLPPTKSINWSHLPLPSRPSSRPQHLHRPPSVNQGGVGKSINWAMQPFAATPVEPRADPGPDGQIGQSYRRASSVGGPSGQMQLPQPFGQNPDPRFLHPEWETQRQQQVQFQQQHNRMYLDQELRRRQQQQRALKEHLRYINTHALASTRQPSVWGSQSAISDSRLLAAGVGAAAVMRNRNPITGRPNSIDPRLQQQRPPQQQRQGSSLSSPIDLVQEGGNIMDMDVVGDRREIDRLPGRKHNEPRAPQQPVHMHHAQHPQQHPLSSSTTLHSQSQAQSESHFQAQAPAPTTSAEQPYPHHAATDPAEREATEGGHSQDDGSSHIPLQRARDSSLAPPRCPCGVPARCVRYESPSLSSRGQEGGHGGAQNHAQERWTWICGMGRCGFLVGL